MASRRFFRSAEQRQQRTPRPRGRSADTTFLVEPRAQAAESRPVQGPLLTVEEARAYLNLPSVHSIYRLVHAPAPNRIPYRRLGRELRFDLGELEQWTRRERQSERPTLVMVKGA